MRWRFILPMAAFVIVAIALGIGLTLEPREIPSALIGKPVPVFELPPVEGRTSGLSTADLKQGRPVLVNVFASWCGPCRQEHPLFIEIARTTDIPIFGLNQRDEPADAARWLATFGDPYDRTGADLTGRVSIDWGVYGVPETFVVDGQGCIQYKHISVMTREVFDEEILPRLRGEKHVPCEG